VNLLMGFRVRHRYHPANSRKSVASTELPIRFDSESSSWLTPLSIASGRGGFVGSFDVDESLDLRTKSTERKGKRVLTDDEIRDLRTVLVADGRRARSHR
jgi:hypothetical protein